MAQRISRAKQSIKAAGAEFAPAAEPERGERLRAVLHVLYLIFNEGYTATLGARPAARRADRARRSGWPARLRRLLPDDGEVAGLLALMLLTDARRPARTRPDGGLVPLAEQDRSLWDADAIREGVALVERRAGAQRRSARTSSRPRSPPCTPRRRAREETDWPQILALYELLERLGAEPDGHAQPRRRAGDGARAAQPGLELLATLDGDERIAAPSPPARRARAPAGAWPATPTRRAAAYREAARRTTSLPEQRYLEARAARLATSSR